jgi:hypothetical protein
MAASAIVRRLEGARAKMRAQTDKVEHRFVVSGSAAAMGWLEGAGTLPVEMFGVPTKLIIGIVGTIVEANSAGSVRRISGSVSDAAFAVYGYNVAKSKQLISGVGDDGQEYVGADDQEYVGAEV